MKDRSVLVAMSGGVDSSVAAGVLAGRGFRVQGLTMLLAPEGAPGPGERDAASGNVRDAGEVCRILGIPHETMDLREEFRSLVVEPFVRTYLAGKTPNPCILCNEQVKFRFLFEKADRMGADMVATGHYARILENGSLGLGRGADRGKDQSYFLFFLGQGELARLAFPLGSMRKEDVRRKAHELGLPVHEKEESQDACFVPPGGVKGFLKRKAAPLPGRGWFVDGKGDRLGNHEGACFYTVGQRRGLGVAAAQPLYVVRIDAEANEVVLGTRDEALSPGLVLSSPRWIEGAAPRTRFRSLVQIRHRQLPVPCSARLLPGGSVLVVFDEPQHGVAPGQAAVFYDGDRVLGGGWISQAHPGVEEPEGKGC